MRRKTRSRKSSNVATLAGQRYSDLAIRLSHHLQERQRCSAGKRIGVAVSGGADSVSLLALLLELQKKLGIVLSVVHFNHKLRGKASDADEKFVADLAKHNNLPFFVAREDINSKSKKERSNLEDVARRARYAFFERLISEKHLDQIAVAHTADDQAETVLAHIFRGTGLAGLGGIHPEVGNIFRPLLKFRRTELRAYLRSQRRTWREDATNRDTKRTRSRIRLKLMPLLEKQLQPAVVEHLCQLADLAREDEAWLESSAQLRLFLTAIEDKGEWRIPLRNLLAPKTEPASPKNPGDSWTREAPQAMSKRLIRLLVKKTKPHSGQLSSIHVEAVLRLAQQPDSGKSLPLPGGVEVRRERETLSFRPIEKKTHAESTPSETSYAHTINLHSSPVELPLPEQSCSLRFTVIDWPPQGRENKVTGAFLDRDRMCFPLVVRSWRPGDSMQPLGHQKPHRLSRLLNELGVSRWQKMSWPVLDIGGKVAWTRGLPVSAEFVAGDSTRQGVEITEVPIS
jgi:tRNA(Ile)-lysidine synthase